MTPANLMNWALQVAALAVLAIALPRLLRMHPARLRLYWLQSVLGICLLLPLVAPWHQETIAIAGGDTDGVTVTTGAIRTAAPAFGTEDVAIGVLLVGMCLRLAWLAAGFARLRRYRLESTELPSADGVSIRESGAIAGPVTFGLFRPVVLLPTAFHDLPAAQQNAVLSHELIHVGRRDWLWMLAEELVRAALWFHPAIWWLTAEIRLTREEVVDAEVVAMTAAKDDYVDALLVFAGASPTPLSTMAPGFIRSHHLKQRISNILREVHMSRTRTISTIFTATAALATVCWLVTNTLPLNAQAQYAADGPGVTVDLNGAALLHRSPVVFPPSAPDGSVVAQVNLDGAGNVSDASILSGTGELRKAVLQSVLNWHFAKSEGGATRQVTVQFQRPAPVAPSPQIPTAVVRVPLPGGTARTLKDVTVNGVPDSVKQQIAAALPVRVGDPLTPEAMSSTLAEARKIDEHLGVSVRPDGEYEARLVLAPAADNATSARSAAVKVGGNVAAANLVSKVNPSYPPLAKAAKVQGTVKFEVMIGVDGHVVDIKLVSGPPLLVQAAMEAVRQWVYKPTLLNGDPVEVVTTVDVNFTLVE